MALPRLAECLMSAALRDDVCQIDLTQFWYDVASSGSRVLVAPDGKQVMRLYEDIYLLAEKGEVEIVDCNDLWDRYCEAEGCWTFTICPKEQVIDPR